MKITAVESFLKDNQNKKNDTVMVLTLGAQSTLSIRKPKLNLDDGTLTGVTFAGFGQNLMSRVVFDVAGIAALMEEVNDA